MSATDASLVRMANQIAANYRHHPPDVATTEVAAHLRRFWAGPMLAEAFALAAERPGDFDPVALAALDALRQPAET